jgi:hypothetical protein
MHHGTKLDSALGTEASEVRDVLHIDASTKLRLAMKF